MTDMKTTKRNWASTSFVDHPPDRLPCGLTRCPICPPISLRDVPADKVTVLPTNWRTAGETLGWPDVTAGSAML